MRLLGLRPLAAITAPVAVATVTLLAPGTAAAEETTTPEPAITAESSLNGVEPSVLTADSTGVTLSGTVRNTGEEPLYNVQALPRFSGNRVESRSEIRDIGTDEELYWGTRHSDGYDPVADVLEPGQAAGFTVTLSSELLGFDSTGIYVVGIDILASPSDDSDDRARVDTSRTVVPWIRDPADLPTVPVGVLWPLAARPNLTPDGILLDDSTAEQLAPGGPLSDLILAGSDAPVTWAVDPDLLATARQMADGYRVASPSGPVDGPQAGTDAAQEWLDLFELTTLDHDVWVLPYAVPDLGAFEQHDPPLATELARQSLAASDAAAQGLPSATAGVAWLDSGSVTDEVLTTLGDAGAETVVVPAGAVESEAGGALGDVTAGDHTLRTVAADGGLSSAAAAADAADDPAAGAVDLQQRWVAETAMAALTAARDDVAPELLVVAPPLRWRPDERVIQSLVDTWTSTPWVEAVDLTDAVAAEQAPEVSPAPAEGTTMLPEASVAATAQLHDDATQYGTLLVDSEDVTEALDHAILRSASTGWRTDPDTGIAYARGITDDLTGRLGRVSVTVPESVTLSSRAGSFPLTLSNELDDPVNVRLEVRSDNPDRLRITEVPAQEMLPGEQRLVEVTAEAAANGRVPIQVQVTTADGRPLGPAVPTVVNATEYGTIGWIIVGVAGALFAAAILRRTLRSKRPRRRRRGTERLDPAVSADLPGLPTEARPTQEAAR